MYFRSGSLKVPEQNFDHYFDHSFDNYLDHFDHYFGCVVAMSYILEKLGQSGNT